MSQNILVDAAHPEETRVVVMDRERRRIEDLEIELKEHKKLRGNIYLAKVLRVESSLQAAFVDYGGQRQGFLSFNEIHPDYFQIPVAHREALLREKQKLERAEEEDTETTLNGTAEHEDEATDAPPKQNAERPRNEGTRLWARFLRSKYKIQEVIKLHQILLVQVIKEERGNKGVGMTTYLSLVGRCCILMPNMGWSGGISRKITDKEKRNKMRKIIDSLDLPEGMSLIIRTTSVSHGKKEISRDFAYLLHLWESIRDLTLRSVAPKFIYEESNLSKRVARDFYNQKTEKIIVEGKETYEEIKALAQILMPEHVNKVRLYTGRTPLFYHYKVEEQLVSLFAPTVQMSSGGYIIINKTEALVAIDVNSGRATKEHSIEATALKTNMEAAEEIARQLRIRDLGGLIVVDFIDMESLKNRRTVETHLKNCMSKDKARFQINHINRFGLLEISRQRMRSEDTDMFTTACPRCSGRGFVRSSQSLGLEAIRLLNATPLTRRSTHICLRLPMDVAFYILNHKYAWLKNFKERTGITVIVDTFPPSEAVRPPEIEFLQEETNRSAGTQATRWGSQYGRSKNNSRSAGNAPRSRKRSSQEEESRAWIT